MALTNDQITAQNFKDFYDKIYPYLGGGGGGGSITDFTGATDQDDGAHGLVPAPQAGDEGKVLFGDGSWGNIVMPSVDYSNEFGAENIYSTQERMIGQWTDGKPLYQKVYQFTDTLPNKGVVKLIEIDSDTTHEHVLLQKTRTINGLGIFNGAIIQVVDTTVSERKLCVRFTNIDNDPGITINGVVISQYTKTTDSAMSIGTPNEYSTTEKIVGTWVDGKPLYQKTFQVTTPNTTGYFANTIISNLETCIKLSFACKNSDDVWITANPSYYTNIVLLYDSNGIKILYVDNPTWIYNKTAYITIQYTKTS